MRPTHLSLVVNGEATSPDDTPAALFVESLPIIDRLVAAIARRHALTAHDADDFRSWVQVRMIENGYAVFRKFGGRSTLATYLTAVLSHLFLDYRNSLWGRWRPCAAAERLGPIGVRLDELLHRDGCSLREAREMLRSRGCELDDRELGRMAASFPVRRGTQELSLDTIEGTTFEADSASATLPYAARDVHGMQALRDAVSALRPEDQVIIRMRFWDGVSVADIAKSLRLDAKPLYRRIELIEKRLRTLLADGGIDRERARDLLSPEVAW
jgi:RNA polymerase sigma factor for flagellar operon FliA